ncbi:MAG: MerR family transcriptional regulator [Candidatus Methylomirabilales bacterium]
MNGLLRIGELAKQVGVTRKAVRYYERLGLLPRPRRSPSGYRLYEEADIGRLLFIKRAKEAGLPLARICDLLPLAEGEECGNLRPRVQDAISDYLRFVNEKVRELLLLREDLEATRSQLNASCRPLRGEACGCDTTPPQGLIPPEAIRFTRRQKGPKTERRHRPK